MKVGLGFDLRTKVPWTFLVATGAILIMAIYLVLVYFGLIEYETIFDWIRYAVFAWTFIMIFAIIGALLVGMFIATRSLSAKGLTPFEASMLRMHEEVRELSREVNKLTEAVKVLSTAKGERSSVGADENNGDQPR